MGQQTVQIHLGPHPQAAQIEDATVVHQRARIPGAADRVNSSSRVSPSQPTTCARAGSVRRHCRIAKGQAARIRGLSGPGGRSAGGLPAAQGVRAVPVLLPRPPYFFVGVFRVQVPPGLVGGRRSPLEIATSAPPLLGVYMPLCLAGVPGFVPAIDAVPSAALAAVMKCFENCGSGAPSVKATGGGAPGVHMRTALAVATWPMAARSRIESWRG